MNAVSPSDQDLARLDEAAEWLQALTRAPLEDALLESWLEWCARDPRNQQAFDGIVAVWGASANLPPAVRAGLQESEVAAPKPAHKNYIIALAASLAAVVCTALIWVGLRVGTDEGSQAIVSAVGVNSTSQLPDGSIMELGGRTNARLKYSAEIRRVDVLEGEVYLTVAKDRERPFVVNAGPVRVAAVGTEFNVRHADARVIVTVSEGSVDVGSAAGSGGEACALSRACIRLTEGQQALYLQDSRSLVVTTVDPQIASAWRTGMLKFVDEPLSSVLSSVNRYSHQMIGFSDEALGRLSFTGTVHVDRIDRWLRALESAFPLSVVESGDQGVLLVPRR